LNWLKSDFFKENDIKVLSEYPQSSTVPKPQNTFNYLPGYAAFAHAFIGGFCGLRPRDFQLDLVYPSNNFQNYQASISSSAQQQTVFKQPGLNVENWNITGLMYRGNKLDIIYNLKTKTVEIRNRRSNDPSLIADENLEIAVYEGTQVQARPLRIGDSVQINLNTDVWTYAAKKSRLQKRTSYSDNMNILASIYPVQFARNIVRPSNSAPNQFQVSFSIFLVLIFIHRKLVTLLTN